MKSATIQGDLDLDPQEDGEVLLRSGRFAEARASFERQLTQSATPEALSGLGQALWWLGEVHQSVSYLRRAYAAFLRRDEAFAAAQAALTLCITCKYCLGNEPAAAGWLARAQRAVAGQSANPLQGYLWFMQACLLVDQDLQAALELSQLALDHARLSGDRDLELCTLGAIGTITVRLGNTEHGLQMVDEAMAGLSGGEYERLDTVVTVNCIMLDACEASHDWDRAARWKLFVDEFLQRVGCPYLYADCRAIYGSMLIARGEWQEAERQLKSVIDLTAGGYAKVHAEAAALLAELYLRQGRVDEAEIALANADDRLETLQARAEMAMVRNQNAAARALLQRCLRRLENDGLAAVRCLELLVAAHTRDGQLGAARDALERMMNSLASEACPEAAARYQFAAGLVNEAAGELEEATLRYESATEAFTRLGLPFEAATARLGIAACQALVNPELAVQEARSARDAFERLGAGPSLDRSSALLRSLGVARPGPRAAGLLTMREREIVELISQGLSNPEIAARLYISRKTAAHHVSSILSKLALRNRAEIVAYAAQSRLS